MRCFDVNASLDLLQSLLIDSYQECCRRKLRAKHFMTILQITSHLQSNHFAIAMHAAQTSLISNHCWLISGSLMKLIVFCIDATALMPSSFAFPVEQNRTR